MLHGGGGNDTLTGGKGKDYLDGGGGLRHGAARRCAGDRVVSCRIA